MCEVVTKVVLTMTNHEAKDLKQFILLELAEWRARAAMSGGSVNGFTADEVKRILKTVARVGSIL